MPSNRHASKPTDRAPSEGGDAGSSARRDLSRFLRRILRRLSARIPDAGLAIFLREPEGWRWKASRGLTVEQRRRWRDAPDDLLGAGGGSNPELAAPDADSPADLSLKSFPCRAGEELVGALVVFARVGRILTREESALAEQEAQRLGAAIRDHRLLQQLIHSKRTWQETFDAITDLILLVDPRCRIVRANRSTADRFGLTMDCLTGLHCRDLFGMEPESCRNCPIKECRRKGEPIHEERRLPGLRDSIFSMSAFPRFDEQGRFRGSVLIYRDISEAHRLREQVRIMDKMSSLGQLVAGIAHELNNPIQSILVFSQILVEEQSRGRKRKLLERIYSEAVRCAKIIQALGAMHDSGPRNRLPVDMHEVIQHAVLLKSYDLDARGIEVTCDLTAQASTVLGAPFRLRQFLVNILTNAVEALRKRPNGKIHIVTRNLSGRLRIGVRDSGIGIAPEHLPKVFDPFFSTRAGANMGLGLSVAYGIVKDHEGTIQVSSEPREGTLVQVELPLHSGSI